MDKKTKVKKPSTEQLHDLAVKIAMQAIDEQIVLHSTSWEDNIANVLFHYVSAMVALEKVCDNVVSDIQSSFDSIEC